MDDYYFIKEREDLSEADLQFLFCGMVLSQTREKTAIISNDFDTLFAYSDIMRCSSLAPDKFGFFKSASSLLEKTLSTIDGIHVVGSAQHPASVGDSIALAHSATAEILSSLMPGRKIELEVATATIDKERCAGCKLCISVCPYSAVVFNSEKKISEVIEAICRGCGTCTASCPSGASKARMFTNEQIAAEIGGLFK